MNRTLLLFATALASLLLAAGCSKAPETPSASEGYYDGPMKPKSGGPAPTEAQ